MSHSPDSILIVDSDRARLARTRAMLTQAGYAVIATASFLEAKRALADPQVGLVIAAIHLGPYNGIHLAVRARVTRRDLPVIITHAEPDAYFEAEASHCGATFVALSSGDAEFLHRVADAASALPKRRAQGIRRTLVPPRANEGFGVDPFSTAVRVATLEAFRTGQSLN